MNDAVFSVLRSFKIPNGKFTKDGEPQRDTATLRTSQIHSLLKTDQGSFGGRSVAGASVPEKFLYSHPEDEEPRENSLVLDGEEWRTARAVFPCRDISGKLRSYKITLG